MQDGLVGLVGELHLFEFQIAVDRSQGDRPAGIGVFFSLRQDLASAVQPGDGLCQLGADVHHLEHRSNHEGQKHGVSEVVAQSDLVGHLLAGAEPHDGGADNTQNGGRGQREQRGGGQGADHILIKPFHSLGENSGFAILRVVALHHPHAA